MSNLSKLSAPKLRAVIDRCEKRWKDTLDATIAAGMSGCRHSDIVQLAKGSGLLHKTKIALDYLNAYHDRRVAYDELDAREKYHGSDKPIRRQA